MLVFSDVLPPEPFSIEPYPKQKGLARVRFYENASAVDSFFLTSFSNIAVLYSYEEYTLFIPLPEQNLDAALIFLRNKIFDRATEYLDLAKAQSRLPAENTLAVAVLTLQDKNAELYEALDMILTGVTE